MALLLFFLLFFLTTYQKSLTRPPRTLATILLPFCSLDLTLRISQFAMKFSAQFTTILALMAPGAFATALPPCSTTSITPCSCPSGTAYQESVTFAVIGAAAIEVKNLISDCPSKYKVSLFSNREDVGPEECSPVINSLSTRVARHRTLCHSRPQQ